MKTYYIENQDIYEHCAFEEELIKAGEPVFAFCSVQESIFIGTNIDYTTSYKEDNIYNIPCVRYKGKGGPVYFANGQIKTILLVQNDGNSMVNVMEWVKKSLLDLGLVTTIGGNDIFLGDKKIGGFSEVNFGELMYLPFFISLNIDFERAKEAIILSKHTTILEERAIGINQFLAKEVTLDSKDIEDSKDVVKTITMSQIYTALNNNFANYFKESIELQSVEKELTDKVDILKVDKYETDLWIKEQAVNNKIKIRIKCPMIFDNITKRYMPNIMNMGFLEFNNSRLVDEEYFGEISIDENLYNDKLINFFKENNISIL